jgi:hypothetical protein
MEKKQQHPTIAMQPCESSQVKAYGFDHATGTLAVEYKSGGIYHYHDVKADTFNAMRKAKSVGKFIGASLKGVHKFTKLETK